MKMKKDNTMKLNLMLKMVSKDCQRIWNSSSRNL